MGLTFQQRLTGQRGYSLGKLAGQPRVLSKIGAWSAGAMLCLCGMLPSVLAGESILVGGNSAGSRLMQVLVDEYRKTTPTAEISVIDPPLGSQTAIEAIKRGKIQIAVSARGLEGEDRDGNLVEIEFARTPLVFATRDGVRRGGFSLRQLAGVFAERVTEWDNGAQIRLILRSQFAIETLRIRAMDTEMDVAMTKALARKGMVFAMSDLEAVQMIENTPGSLGPTTLGLLRLLKSDAQVLPINGRTPSVKALADGSYPWFKTIYLIVPKHPGPELQAFVSFLQSRQAGEVLTRTEYAPLFHGK
jgi:phosphate transport system substrate-binding protein